MKTFKEFLTEKGHNEDAFKALDSAEQAKLYAEYNSELQTANKEAIEKKADDSKVDEIKKEMQDKLDEAIKSMKENAQLEVKISKAEAATESLKEIVKMQGAELKKRKVTVSSDPVFKEFEEKFNEQAEKVSDNSRDELRFRFKADNPQTFTAGAVAGGVYGVGAIPANADADMMLVNSYGAPGVYEGPKRRPDFLDKITNRNPIESGMMHAVVQTTENGAAAVVGETAIKPYASLIFELEKIGTKTIAVLWKESRKWRKNFSYLLPKVRQHMAYLVSVKLEDEVYADVAGTAFVPNAELQFTAPKKLEAIGATIYSQMNLEFNPDVVLVNPIDYATMVHSKATDEHYDAFNNGSVRIINGTQIVSGSNIVDIVLSKRVAPGSYFVGDMSALIFGLENEVEYSQGYVNDDFERNLITNRLEIDMALMIPSVLAGAFVKDTYANVLPQITAA